MLDLQFLFEKLTWGRIVSHILVTKFGTNYQVQWKNNISLNILKHEVKKKTFIRIKNVILLLSLTLLSLLLL